MTFGRVAILIGAVALLGCAREKPVQYPPPGSYGPLPGIRSYGGLPPNAALPVPPSPPSTPAPSRPPSAPQVAWPWTSSGWQLPPGWSIAGLPLPLPTAPTGTGGDMSGGGGIAAGARYGSLSPAECFAELARRGIAYRAVSQARGVEMPMRLAGPLRGVQIIAAGAGKVGTNSAYDILDCRLALSLDDFAGVVSARGIVRVDHMSMYRNGATVAGKGTPSQHAYGLAIDIGSLRRADGQVFTVQRDWATVRGSPPCPGPPLETGGAAALRDVVCSSIQRDVFNTYITPNHNAAHDNHFHFDLVIGEPGIYAELH